MASKVIAGDRATLNLESPPRIGTPLVSALNAITGDHAPLEGKNEVTWEELPLIEASRGHDFVIQDFVQAINEDRPPFVTGEEGRRALELVNAILYSAFTGRAVKLPLDRNDYDRLMGDLIEGSAKIQRRG
jgi:predicted dehydrogenase